jgi:hypothetical protein
MPDDRAGGEIGGGFFAAGYVVERFGLDKVAVGAGEGFALEYVRTGSQPFAVAGRQRFTVADCGISGEIDEFGAVDAAGDGVIVIAGQRHGGETADQRHRVFWLRPVPDHIAETDYPARTIEFGIFQNRSQGDFVCMDIGYYRVDHLLSAHKCAPNPMPTIVAKVCRSREKILSAA